MSGYNEILEGRFNRSLQRLFNMKGPASMNELGSIMQPQLQVHTDADQRFNESWDSFGFFAPTLGAAAGGSSLRFRNPPSSNVLAVFTRINLASGGGAAADSIVLEIGATTVDSAGGSAIGRSLDTRTIRNSAIITSINPAGGAVALGSAIAQFSYIAAVTISETQREFLDGFQRIVLTPGFALQLRNSANNQNFNANVLWEERPLGDAEVK